MKDNKSTIIYPSVIALLVLILFIPIYKGLFERFTARDSYYSHGFLIPFISLFLVWRRRKILKTLPVKPCGVGLFVLAGGVIIYLISLALKINFSSYFAIPIIINGIVLYAGGKKITKELLFPIWFLVFMLPLPKVLIIGVAYKLKSIVGEWAAFAVGKMGIEAKRVGSTIHYPGGFLLIGDPCSGLRSLISFLALGALFTQFTDVSLWKKNVVFLFTIPIALFSNFLRVISLVVLSYIYGEGITKGFAHDFSGIMVFIIGFLCFLGVIKLLKCPIKTEVI